MVRLSVKILERLIESVSWITCFQGEGEQVHEEGQRQDPGGGHIPGLGPADPQYARRQLMILSPVVSNFKIDTFLLPSPGLKPAHTFHSSLQVQEKEEIYQSGVRPLNMIWIKTCKFFIRSIPTGIMSWPPPPRCLPPPSRASSPEKTWLLGKYFRKRIH